MSVGLQTNASPRHYYTPSMVTGSDYITRLLPVFHYNALQAGKSTAYILHLPNFMPDPIPVKEKEEPGPKTLLLISYARCFLTPVPMACKPPSSSSIMFPLESQESSLTTTTHCPPKLQVDLTKITVPSNWPRLSCLWPSSLDFPKMHVLRAMNLELFDQAISLPSVLYLE